MVESQSIKSLYKRNNFKNWPILKAWVGSVRDTMVPWTYEALPRFWKDNSICGLHHPSCPLIVSFTSLHFFCENIGCVIIYQYQSFPVTVLFQAMCANQLYESPLKVLAKLFWVCLRVRVKSYSFGMYPKQLWNVSEHAYLQDFFQWEGEQTTLLVLCTLAQLPNPS